MNKIGKIKIGGVKLDNNIFFAPMAGITDYPVRTLAKEGGAGLVYTEMVSAKALLHADEKTKKLLYIGKKERPAAAQIFGGDPYTMGEAAKITAGFGADIIDINLGCPVRKIAKAGAGAKLLANAPLTAKILESVVQNAGVPVTAKIRIGLVPGQNVAPEIIKIAYESGIKMVAVHARPASQGHCGEPDLNAFAEACIGAKIPVFANGGITDEKSAEKFLNIENCSGIMIGRGAIGNYDIFERLAKYFKTGKVQKEPTLSDKISWFKRHVKLSVKYYGEKRGLVLIRKTAQYYIKEFPDAAKARAMFSRTETLKGFDGVLEVLETAVK